MKTIDHYSYPAIVTYFDNGSTETYFPDFDIYTESEDDKDLMKYAKELLSVLIEGILDDEEFLPEPSKLQDCLDELFVNTKEVLNGLINTIYENDLDVPMPSESDDIKLKSGEFLILVKADLSSNMIENAYIKSDEEYYEELVKRALDMKK